MEIRMSTDRENPVTGDSKKPCRPKRIKKKQSPRRFKKEVRRPELILCRVE